MRAYFVCVLHWIIQDVQKYRLHDINKSYQIIQIID
jgi:hypothetical protein